MSPGARKRPANEPAESTEEVPAPADDAGDDGQPVAAPQAPARRGVIRWLGAARPASAAGSEAPAATPDAPETPETPDTADTPDTPTASANPATSATSASSATSAQTTQELPPPNEMLPKEQQIGYLLAALVVAWVGAAGGSRVVQGKSTYILLTVLGLAAAGAIVYATRRGRRMLSAIVAVVAGLAVSGFFPLNFACLVFGGYLMLRQSQAQKKYNQIHPRQPRQARERGGFSEGRGAGRRAGRGSRSPEPPSNRPQASRRYTPPKSKTNRRGR